MPNFSYTGRSNLGSFVQGELDAVSAEAVADVLLGQGVTPLNIAPAPASQIAAVLNWRASQVGDDELMLFSRQMHTLLRAGVPIMRALASLQESTVNPAMIKVLNDVRDSLQSGRELSVALARHPEVFSDFYVSMIRVGEMTGQMDEIFLRLFHHLEFEKFMREQISSAVRYPIFVMIVMTAALLVINFLVIPAFSKVYKGMNAELPLLTRGLIGFSDFMLAYWPALLAGAAALIYGVAAAVRTPSGRLAWGRFKLRVPIMGKIVLKATLSRFSRSLALALKSGVPIVQALMVTAQVVDNDHIAARIEKMRAGVERGESVLRTAINAGVFTPVVLQMVAVGEESGALDELLQEIAGMYQRETEYELKTLSAQIEPILIVFLGALVLVVALGVFLPIWDLGKVMMH